MYSVDCPICGKYEITLEATCNKETFANRIWMLQSAARGATADGRDAICITSTNVDQIVKAIHPPRDDLEAVERLLICMAKRQDINQSRARFRALADWPLLAVPGHAAATRAVNIAVGAKYLRPTLMCDSGEYSDFQGNITVDGWRYIRELRKSTAQSNRAFVAMWFPDKEKDADNFELMERVYSDAIETALQHCGYENAPFRVDKQQHNEPIPDRIIANIRRSSLVIADVTHDAGTGMRGGVYFEAGFAQGLGREVIWTARRGTRLSFNTQGLNHIMWSHDDLEAFKQQLIDRIEARDPRRADRADQG